MNRELPSQGMCLWLSQMYWEMKPQTKRNRELSWEYLIAWGFYEMYEQEWVK